MRRHTMCTTSFAPPRAAACLSALPLAPLPPDQQTLKSMARNENMLALRRAAGLESNFARTAAKGQRKKEDSAPLYRCVTTGEEDGQRAAKRRSRDSSNTTTTTLTPPITENNGDHDSDINDHAKEQSGKENSDTKGGSEATEGRLAGDELGVDAKVDAPSTHDGGDVDSTDLLTAAPATSKEPTTAIPPSANGGGPSSLSSIASRSSTNASPDGDAALLPDCDVNGAWGSKKTPKTINVTGKARREEARRRLELYQVFPMAAEWGGLSLTTLLKHGLLEKRAEITAISAEAAAGALLQQTLQVMDPLRLLLRRITLLCPAK